MKLKYFGQLFGFVPSFYTALKVTLNEYGPPNLLEFMHIYEYTVPILKSWLIIFKYSRYFILTKRKKIELKMSSNNFSMLCKIR